MYAIRSYYALKKEQKSNYYIAQINLNRYRDIFLPKSEFQPDYGLRRAAYQDSLIAVIDNNTPEYHVAKADRFFDNGEYENMRDEMILSLGNLKPEDRAYGYTSYTLAYAYGMLGVV